MEPKIKASDVLENAMLTVKCAYVQGAELGGLLIDFVRAYRTEREIVCHRCGGDVSQQDTHSATIKILERHSTRRYLCADCVLFFQRSCEYGSA